MNNQEREILQEKVRFYEAVLDNIYNGVMITDPEGKIIFFSKTYGNFLGIDPKEVIGKHCTEVVENTRMHIVSKTGIPEIDHPHRYYGSGYGGPADSDQNEWRGHSSLRPGHV